MSRTVGSARTTRVAGVAAMLLVLAFSGVPGCESDGLWPREATLVGSVRMAGAARLPGSEALDGKAVFLRRTQEQSAETSGAVTLKEYEEVVLINPRDPSDREVVCRIRGKVEDVRCVESSETSAQAIAVLWRTSGGAPAAYALLVRSADGKWESVWSQVQGEEAAFAIRAWGFADGNAESGPSLWVVVDADASPSRASWQSLRVGLDGSTDQRGLAGSQWKSVDYLCTYLDDGRLQTAFRCEAEGKEGLLVTDSATGVLREIKIDGRPLLVVGREGGSPSVLVRPTQTVHTGIRIVSMRDTDDVRVLEGVDGWWAGLMSGTDHGSEVIALVDLHSTDGEVAE